jgi:hypothetical protein
MTEDSGSLLLAAQLRASVFAEAIDYAGADKPDHVITGAEDLSFRFESSDLVFRGVKRKALLHFRDCLTMLFLFDSWPLDSTDVTDANPRDVMASIHAFLGQKRNARGGARDVSDELTRMCIAPTPSGSLLSDWVCAILRMVACDPIAMREARHVVSSAVTCETATEHDREALQKAALLLAGLNA